VAVDWDQFAVQLLQPRRKPETGSRNASRHQFTGDL
jgi:hypothetical protein